MIKKRVLSERQAEVSVNNTIITMAIEGLYPDDVTIECCRKIARGESTADKEIKKIKKLHGWH